MVNAGAYRIDPAGSTIHFATRHLFGLAPVVGTFAIASGAIRVSEPVDESFVDVAIDASRFRTRSRRRDIVVRGPRFLDTARYLTITFRGAGVDLVEGGATLTGTLTVLDIACSV